MQTRNASDTTRTLGGSQAAELGAYDSETNVRHIHQLRPRSRNHTAFVFSGGGARGALHVGALRALLEHGVRPDVVVGTSIGAWNAAWLGHPPLGAPLAP